MSSSDESKLPDNVITVDFRRRVVVTESGEKPVPGGGGELVSLPFGAPPKAEGAESAARAQARLLAARAAATSSEPVVAEKPKRTRKATATPETASVESASADVAPAPKKPRAKKAATKAEEAGSAAPAAVEKPKKSAARPKKTTASSKEPAIPIAPPVSFLSMEKLARFQSFIKENLTAVTFDTRAAGVEVPRQFRGVPRLILNFSHNFHIPDFAYDEQGVRATLSFETGEFFVQIPWDAIYVMVVPKTKEAAMWDVSVPVELAALIPALRRSLFPNGPV